jgi:hypothetical protein
VPNDSLDDDSDPNAAIAEELAKIEQRRAELQAQATQLKKQSKLSSKNPRKKSPVGSELESADDGVSSRGRGTRGDTGDDPDKDDESDVNEVQVVEKPKGRRPTKPSAKVRENIADAKVAKEARVRKNTQSKAKKNQKGKALAARAALDNLRQRRS